MARFHGDRIRYVKAPGIIIGYITSWLLHGFKSVFWPPFPISETPVHDHIPQNLAARSLHGPHGADRPADFGRERLRHAVRRRMPDLRLVPGRPAGRPQRT